MSPTQANLHDDDHVLPFAIEHLEVSGRLVRLGPAIDEILARHAYPDRVSQVLGQALLLVAMFGSMVKGRQTIQPGQADPNAKERFILQTQTDGAINLIVADYVHPGHLRGYARFNADRINELEEDELEAKLLGKGHLAMTIDRGSDTDRYQGIVSLDDEGPNIGLSGAANQYFQQSEQLPTFIRLAMAKHFDAMVETPAQDWRWRGGALMIQKLTSVGGLQKSDPLEPTHVPDADDDDESWSRTHILSRSIKDHELLDPLLSSGDLLYRLYHQDGVRIFDAVDMKAACSCSLKGVENMLAGFTRGERKDMIKGDGKVHITCEFCNRAYEVTPSV